MPPCEGEDSISGRWNASLSPLTRSVGEGGRLSDG